MGDPTIEAARELFDEAFGQMRDAIDGLSADALAWRPPAEDTNPITVLAVHSMHSTPVVAHDRARPPARNGSAIGVRRRDGRRCRALGFLDRMVSECRERLDPAEAFDAGAERSVPDDEPVTAGWALLHALEHLREHVAQAQLATALGHPVARGSAHQPLRWICSCSGRRRRVIHDPEGSSSAAR